MCNLPNVIWETSCAMSLTSGTQNDVDHYCSRHIIPFPQPVAYRLGINGQWLYSIPEPTVLDVKCPDRTLNYHVILEGQQVIQIPDSCMGYANKFKMPPHFQGENSIIINFQLPPFLALLDNYIALSDQEQETLQNISKREINLEQQS